MKFDKQAAEDLQLLADFCGPRDTCSLSREEVRRYFQGKPADAAILFGGSIVHGADLMVQVLQEHSALHTGIVGGYGHTTAALQKQLEPYLHTILPTEAESFQALLLQKGVQADFLETRSTNCGNNIAFLLAMLEDLHIDCHRIVLIQDASMQRRMAATMYKYRPDMQILNYAASQVQFGEKDGELWIPNPPEGMWTAEEYARLLAGEIFRLQDCESGYGPKGKHFIAHVDIPHSVLEAYHRLIQQYPHLIRPALSAYAAAKS